MAITPLPTPPSRSDPANFADRGDAFLGALPTFVTEANALATTTNQNEINAELAETNAEAAQVAAEAAQAAAVAAKNAAEAAANVSLWVSGTTYNAGVVVYSPISFLSYRRKITGAGTTDPSLDGTNWELITGNVTLAATQTLTNKTLTEPAIIGTIVEDVYTITDGVDFEIDPSNGSVQLITLGASRTPKATNFAAGEAITIMIDDGTDYTITWTDATWGGSGVIWATDGGVAPTLNTAGYTSIVLWKVSSQVYGARVGDA